MQGFEIKEMPDGAFELYYAGARVEVGSPEIEDAYTACAFMRAIEEKLRGPREQSEREQTRRLPSKKQQHVDRLRARLNF